MKSLLDAKTFKKLQKSYRLNDELREKIIKLSRDIQKESKQAVYALQRKDRPAAREKIARAKKIISQIKKLIKNNVVLGTTGSFYAALEEYVEAVCLLAFIENRHIPNPETIGVGVDVYLQGLADLTGELVRVAVNDIIAGNFKNAMDIKKFTAELYAYMLGFDFRNTLLRKKFDAIKYNLEKIEDLVLELKVKGKTK